MSAENAEKDAGLSEPQVNCLCAVWLGSKGSGSNARTLDSLLRRGLVTVRQHQGAPLWETSPRGDDLAAAILHPDDTPITPTSPASAENGAALRGLTFRVEVACDGYANLMDPDVPDGVFDLAAYRQGAHDAAEGIRSAVRAIPPAETEATS